MVYENIHCCLFQFGHIERCRHLDGIQPRQDNDNIKRSAVSTVCGEVTPVVHACTSGRLSLPTAAQSQHGQQQEVQVKIQARVQAENWRV